MNEEKRVTEGNVRNISANSHLNAFSSLKKKIAGCEILNSWIKFSHVAWKNEERD